MTHALFLQMRTIARYTVLEARRNRLPGLVALVILAAIAIAGFLSQVAITETQQIQAAFLGALLRWVAAMTLSLFVITSMVRDYNDKGFELVLSFALPRAGYFFGKLLGFALVALGVAAAVSLPLLIFAAPLNAAAWSFSLYCELLMVVAASMVCMLTFTQVTPAFITVAAFYVLARSIGALQLMGRDIASELNDAAYVVVSRLVDVLSFVLPDLGRFTASEWLVYASAHGSELVNIAGQSVIYVLLLTGVGLVDLYRKNL